MGKDGVQLQKLGLDLECLLHYRIVVVVTGLTCEARHFIITIWFHLQVGTMFNVNVQLVVFVQELRKMFLVPLSIPVVLVPFSW